MRYPCQSTNRFLLLYCLLGYLLPVICGCAQGLQIDEIMLNNRAVLADEHGDYPDWIELVNHSAQSISIAGYGLSDRPDQPFRYRCPDVKLEPGERWIVFCSGKQESQALRKPLWQASPPKLDGLILHLDAAWEQALIMDAQGGVTAWMDRSPGMSHAVFAGSGPAPALGDQDPLGRRSVFFDGKGQFMAMKEVTGRTLFLVAAEHPFASNHYRTPIGHRDEVTLHRGGNRAILNPIWGSAYESQGVYLNGREIDATQTRFPCSPSILQFQASSPQRFNLLGSDRLIDNYFWHGHLHEIL
ncbi:MAG: lamin tail domain-containing protein, partial [Verrucomicrobiota bacterium]